MKALDEVDMNELLDYVMDNYFDEIKERVQEALRS